MAACVGCGVEHGGQETMSGFMLCSHRIGKVRIVGVVLVKYQVSLFLRLLDVSKAEMGQRIKRTEF